MANHKRKIYSTQRNKLAIQVAKYLKEKGIISKQAKLHGGKYISREVLAKVHKYQDAAALGYTTVKVSKATAKAAKDRGFQVVRGNRIIGPATPTFRNRLKAGQMTGIRPVKGGYLEEVELPHTIYDFATLIEHGDIDSLKLPNEYFAFTYNGGESKATFGSTKQLIDYIMGYKSVQRDLEQSQRPEDRQEAFEKFVIMRLHPNDVRLLIPNAETRYRRAMAKRAQMIRDGQITKRRGRSWADKLENMSPRQAARVREKKRLAAEKYREKMSKVDLKAYKEKGRERARQSYLNRTKTKTPKG